MSGGATRRVIERGAPAKFNLFLEVLGRRDDGYHEVETLMVRLDLCDRLTFEDDPSGELRLACDDPALPTGPDNLVIKAAERLRAAAGYGGGASIGLAKAVPAEAGLAGGSSDAAATIAALDELWGLDLGGERLGGVAGEVGSDVAFFLNGPAAVCRGRGERVESVAVGGVFWFVLVCPSVGVRTADVYRALPPGPRDRIKAVGPALEALAGGDPAGLGRALFNRLQATAEATRPELGRVRDALAGMVPSGLEGALMSGSGSAYFGLARDRDAADAAARRLQRSGLGQVRVVSCGPTS